MTSATQVKDALRILVAIVVLVIVVIIFAVTIGFFMHYCPVIEQGDKLTTTKTCYEQGGEEVVFIFRNTEDESIVYDSDLHETLEIYNSDGELVVMVPSIQGLGLVTLEPNETLEWSWDQTYYLWEYGELGNVILDDKNGEQVPLGQYKAKISFGGIEEEVTFRITL